jgi:hypothetical protein
MHQQPHGANMATPQPIPTQVLSSAVRYVRQVEQIRDSQSLTEEQKNQAARCFIATLSGAIADSHILLSNDIAALIGLPPIRPTMESVVASAIHRGFDQLLQSLPAPSPHPRIADIAAQTQTEQPPQLSDPRDQWIGKPLIIYDREMKSKSLKGALIAEYYGGKNILYNVEEENFKHLSDKDIVFIDYQPRCGFTTYGFAERLIERVPA